MDCTTPGFPVLHFSWSLLKLMSIESVMPSNHLILCRYLLLLSSIFASIRVFSNESVFHTRWAKYWRFSFSISLSNEYSGLISLRMTDLISLLSKGLSGVFSSNTVQVFPTILGVSWFIIHESNPYLGSHTVFSLDVLLSHPLKGQQS